MKTSFSSWNPERRPEIFQFLSTSTSALPNVGCGSSQSQILLFFGYCTPNCIQYSWGTWLVLPPIDTKDAKMSYILWHMLSFVSLSVVESPRQAPELRASLWKGTKELLQRSFRTSLLFQLSPISLLSDLNAQQCLSRGEEQHQLAGDYVCQKCYCVNSRSTYCDGRPTAVWGCSPPGSLPWQRLFHLSTALGMATNENETLRCWIIRYPKSTTRHPPSTIHPSIHAFPDSNALFCENHQQFELFAA